MNDDTIGQGDNNLIFPRVPMDRDLSSEIDGGCEWGRCLAERPGVKVKLD